MEEFNGKEAFYAAEGEEWRQWLEKNGNVYKSILLIMHHKGSTKPSINYEDAMLQALCFGWVDSRADKRDKESFYLNFSPRKAGSKWSQVNKARVKLLNSKGLMAPEGQAVIDLAKKNGAWDALNDAIDGKIPEDLLASLEENEKALANFEAFPPSSKRMILEWVLGAKRPETRQSRIEHTVKLAAINERANHPKKK
ncbi:MAG: YdeI/OmpD-associated family protein [Saprospiraceae bacterium]